MKKFLSAVGMLCLLGVSACDIQAAPAPKPVDEELVKQLANAPAMSLIKLMGESSADKTFGLSCGPSKDGKARMAQIGTSPNAASCYQKSDMTPYDMVRLYDITKIIEPGDENYGEAMMEALKDVTRAGQL